MKILLIICMLFSFVGCSEVIAEEEKMIHMIEFRSLENTWIDFDYENNQWIYQGDLMAMQEIINDEMPNMWETSGLIILEIIRELREENK